MKTKIERCRYVVSAISDIVKYCVWHRMQYRYMSRPAQTCARVCASPDETTRFE
jgi:hypothetical protein